MAIAKKHPRGNIPKIKRGAGQINQEQAEWVREQTRKWKEEHPNRVQAPPVYGSVPQKPTKEEIAKEQMEKINRQTTAIAIIIFSVIMAGIIVVLVVDWAGSDDGGSYSSGSYSYGGNNCGLDDSTCGDMGYGIIVNPSCDCPAACGHYRMISDGNKQCEP